MITQISVFSELEGVPELQLGGPTPNDDALQIRDIQGLGPVKAELSSSDLATGRGAFYQGASTGKRNIVLTLGLNPDWQMDTPASLRQMLYGYFMPEAKVTLRFYSDDLPPVEAEGVVESFEPNIFSQDPEIQVSVICHQPDFLGITPVSVTHLVNDGLVEVPLVYSGTLATGFEVTVKSTTGLPTYTGHLTIINQAPDLQQSYFTPVTIDSAGYFRLNTVKTQRKVQRVATADGSVTNLLSKMSYASVWPELKPGANLISVAANVGGQEWTLSYFNRYGGL